MFRTSLLTAATLALLSSAAFAQGNAAPNGPPAQLSGGNPNSYDDRAAPADRDYGPDDRYAQEDRDAPPPPANSSGNQAPQTQQQAQASRDLFCRRDAAARTGYVTPDQAASRAQTNGSVAGTVTGAALGAIIGAGSHAAGPGALIGAGAGLIAGTAIGSDNAKAAAADVQRAYADAYDYCMSDAGGPPPSGRYAYGPPPPGYYAPNPYPYPYYYPPYYYGPNVVFGFHGGFGGGFRGGFRGRR